MFHPFAVVAASGCGVVRSWSPLRYSDRGPLSLPVGSVEKRDGVKLPSVFFIRAVEFVVKAHVLKEKESGTRK